MGEKRPNTWGLCDMHGNLWEWCQDWHRQEYYAASPADDPVNLHSGNVRVLRGVSWSYDLPDRFRCAYRANDHPDCRNYFYGFRVATTLTP